MVGYYTFKISLEQFHNGGSLELGYEGFGATISENAFTETAPYYALIRLFDVQV
jgi:hypothetical protein